MSWGGGGRVMVPRCCVMMVRWQVQNGEGGETVSWRRGGRCHDGASPCLGGEEGRGAVS